MSSLGKIIEATLSENHLIQITESSKFEDKTYH